MVCRHRMCRWRQQRRRLAKPATAQLTLSTKSGAASWDRDAAAHVRPDALHDISTVMRFPVQPGCLRVLSDTCVDMQLCLHGHPSLQWPSAKVGRQPDSHVLVSISHNKLTTKSLVSKHAGWRRWSS